MTTLSAKLIPFSAAGTPGPPGPAGSPGPGVPNGGTTAQVLAKNSNANQDTHWVDPAAGGGGTVTSVDGNAGPVVTLATDAAAGTGSKRTLGTGALQAAAGNDSRFTNARTPTAHATSHQLGGTDELSLDPSQVSWPARTSVFKLKDNTDATKTLAFDLTSQSSGVDVTVKLPSLSVDTTEVMVLRDSQQKLTSKNVVSGATDFLAGGPGGRFEANGGGTVPFHAYGGFLGLDFVATEFNGGTASLDCRSTEGASFAALGATTIGRVMGAWHIGGSHDTTRGLTDCAEIDCVATENFSSTDLTASGNRWAFSVTPNGIGDGNKYCAFTIDHDGQLIPGSPDTIQSGTTTTRDYTVSGIRPQAFFGTKNTQTFKSSYTTPVIPATFRTSATFVINAPFPASNSYQGGFFHNPVIKNDPVNGTGDWASGAIITAYGFREAATLTIDTQTGRNLGIYRSFSSAWTVNRTNSGTFTTGTAASYTSAPTVGAGVTLANVVHFAVTDVANTGTITNQTGINVPPLTAAGTNIGISNASTRVAVPTVATITAVGNTIAHTAESIELNNTSGSSKTLTSAPTITDGVDGETVTIYNGSANDVVLQDQGTLASSNLRLGATTRTLSTRDSIRLRYSSTVGDWIEIGFSNVL